MSNLLLGRLILTVAMAVAIATIFLSPNASAFSGNGSGTEIDPYQITNVNELQEIQDNLIAHYILTNDIDASATSDPSSGRGLIQ